jgi:hypothetical protein
MLTPSTPWAVTTPRYSVIAGVVGVTAVLLWPQDQQFGGRCGDDPERRTCRRPGCVESGGTAAQAANADHDRREPRGVVERSGSDSADGDRFVAPVGDGGVVVQLPGLRPLRRGNFKISGDGVFQAVLVQAFAVRGAKATG